MTDQEKIEARLANAEKAIFALATVMEDAQPPFVQEAMSRVLGEFFDANVSLGFEKSVGFIYNTDE